MSSQPLSFDAALTMAINDQLSTADGGPFTLVATPSQGNFLWDYVSANGIFNDGTFSYISAAVSPSTDGVLAQLSPAGGFVNAYVQVLAPIYYALSTADQQSIAQATWAARGEALAMVTAYESAFGTITTADLQTASEACGPFAVQTSQDYILAFVLGDLWSGRSAAGGQPLTYEELAAAGSLAALQQLLPDTPATGQAVVTAAWSYLDAIAGVAAIQTAAQMGSWTLAQLMMNAAAPTEANGGMKTVDPLTGFIFNGWQVGYSVGTPVQAISAALADSSRTLEVVIDVADPGSTATADVSGAGTVTIDATTFALFADDDGNEVNLLTAGDPAAVTITITYTGYTVVPVAPAPFDAATGTGWFLADPIAAAANATPGTSGYAFALPPSYDLQSFAAGGTFGLLTTLLISNAPTITFTYSGVSGGAQSTSTLPMPITGTLCLFSDAGPVLRAVCEAGMDGADLELTFVTAQTDATVPALMRSAFVIGCTIANPGVAT